MIFMLIELELIYEYNKSEVKRGKGITQGYTTNRLFLLCPLWVRQRTDSRKAELHLRVFFVVNGCQPVIIYIRDGRRVTIQKPQRSKSNTCLPQAGTQSAQRTANLTKCRICRAPLHNNNIFFIYQLFSFEF